MVTPFSKGTPRNWYMAPFALGVLLFLLGILIILYPFLLVIILAVPMLFGGVILILIGLDLWIGMEAWRERIHALFSRRYPPDDDYR